jgi:hypothetical protein
MRSCATDFGQSYANCKLTQTSYCFTGIGNLDCEPLSRLPRALWSGGPGFAAEGSGRAPAPV